jgi:transaldolase
MADESLQAEVERLRAEVESYKQRELADLKSALAAVIVERDNYRNEAYRNAEAGRAINDRAEETIARLKSQLEAKEQVLRGRVTSANLARN